MTREINHDAPSGTSNIHQQLFLPCEILHLRDLTSTKSISSSPNINVDVAEGQHLIVCHKDPSSFYKSTRKISRTSNRLWSALASKSSKDGDDTTSCVKCDGYFIGRKQQSSPTSVDKNQDANAAIIKRISFEFGERFEILLDEPNISVSRFASGGSDDPEGAPNSQTKEGNQDNNLHVIFFDLDATVPDLATDLDFEEQESAQKNMHHDFMQTVLSLLMQNDAYLGKNSIVHVRSEVMYQIVTSMGSSTASDNGSSSVSGVELEKYLLSNQAGDGDTNNDNTASSSSGSNKVIRRLRNKKGAANCPLTIYPPRFVELPPQCSTSSSAGRIVEICRFHSYDAERGCLRSKKAELNSEVKGCDMDHDHCHRCGGRHRAFECPDADGQDDAHLSSVVFKQDGNGGIISVPYHDQNTLSHSSRGAASLPALLVLGGRLRGRTLATCEMLPLSSSSSNNGKEKWIPLPNLIEHRGSHAACTPVGSGLAFVLGGGTADGNSNATEILDFGLTGKMQSSADNNTCQEDTKVGTDGEWRWNMMEGKLASPRHAFEAVSCLTSKKLGEHGAMRSANLFAVGGWKYGSVSCESVERLSFEYPDSENRSEHGFDSQWLQKHAQWELCAPLLLPRRLHSVAASTDGSSIHVFGGFIDDRRTTSSIERYDIDANEWSAVDELPYGNKHNCPLVQAVADHGSFLIFPYSTTEQANEDEAPLVSRYTPGTDMPFSQIVIPNDELEQHVCLPIANWHAFAATSSPSLNRVFLVGGTINGKWTSRSFELNLETMEWNELPAMTFARRRLATLVLE